MSDGVVILREITEGTRIETSEVEVEFIRLAFVASRTGSQITRLTVTVA